MTRYPLSTLLLACLWCWATLIPLRVQAIPLWVFAGGSSPPASGGTSPGTASLLFWLDLEANGNDSSANARNFTVNGTVTYPTAKVGNGMFTNASDEFLSIAHAAWQNPAGSFTIAMWIKPTDASPASATGFVSKWNTSSQRAILLSQGTDGKTNAVISSDGNTLKTITTTGSRLDDTWCSIIFVFTASTRMEIFVNGVSEAADTSSVPASIHNSTASLSIGQYSSAFLLGTYDSVAMYSKAFTADEIAWFHNSGNGRQFSDL